jgi:hypothetical protein
MPMIPRTIRWRLRYVRWCERLLRLAWLSARWLTALVAVLALACAADWLIDMRRDTPRPLRVGMLAGQAVLWSAAVVMLLRVLARRMRDSEVALWIEDKRPELRHRLISAVQLNQRGAQTEGMSPDMIAAVTRQAEEQVARDWFEDVLDLRRLPRSIGLLASVLAACWIVSACFPDTVRILLARQMLVDLPIPHSVDLWASKSAQVWAAGEENVLRFDVVGPVAAEDSGEVLIEWSDGRTERHALVFESKVDLGATFVVHMPPGTEDFTYQAWLRDGHTHELSRVHYEPRPVVEEVHAWVRLPVSCGLCPNGQPFEEPQKGGDVVFRVVGSEAHVVVRAQKPIARATVELLGPAHPFAAKMEAAGAESVRRRVRLDVPPGGEGAEGFFSFQPGPRVDVFATLAAAPGVGGPASLPWAALVLSQQNEPLPTETAYRIVVEDEYGLSNREPPRRSIRTAPVPLPEVALLPETLWKPGMEGDPEDYEIEGIPVLLGQRIPLAYRASAVYGLSHAQLRYRVVRRATASAGENEAVREGDFLPLPLGALAGSPHAASKKAEEEFSPRPAGAPDQLDGIEAEGRFDFDSGGIPDGKGGLLRLEEGDRIQIYIEAFGRADSGGAPGRSAVREKEVVGQREFLDWWEKKEDQKERIRQLEERQRSLMGTAVASNPPLPLDTPPESLPGPVAFAPPPEALVFGRSWQLVGPFANEKDAGHVRPYPPEQEAVNLSKEYEGLGRKVHWQLHDGSDGLIDLQKFFHHGEAGVAYAVCWVQTPSRRAVLATGSDDGIKVWIDRKVVLDRPVHREAVPRDDLTPVQLRAGWHEVLVKVDNRFGTWAFYLQLLEDSATGKPLRDLRVRTTPPASEERRFVRRWQVVGPMVNMNDTGHDKVLPPEVQPFHLRAIFLGRHSRVNWAPLNSGTDRIDLLKQLSMVPERSDGVAYAACWVRAPRERQVILAAGSDDGIKVWLNRNLVLDKAGQREAEPGQDRMPITLQAGWNELLVKLDHRQGPWGFFLELRDPRTDAPAGGLELRGTPPPGKTK